MSDALFLGIDIGTQSLRAGLFAADGRALAFADRPLTTSYPQPAWAEQQPGEWWSALCQAVPECLRKANARADTVAALALDNASCTVLAVDEQGQPLRPALLWMDQRAHAEAAQVTASATPHLRYAGRSVSPEWMIPKALWLRRHEPQTYAQAAVICESIDWLNWRLTGRWVAARNNATCKWNYARPAGGWPDPILAHVGAPDLRARWPGNGDTEPLYPGAVIDPLTNEAARALGLQPGTPVVQGAIDAYAAVIGMNALRPGQLALILGSSTCHMAITASGVFGTGSWGPYPDALVPGLWVLEGGQTSTGSVVHWVEQTMGGGRSLTELDALATEASAGAGGLLALDYWQGNRSPRQDPLARGVFVGLSLSHTAGHLLRAVYEATAYGTRHILADMADQGFQVAEMVACGGGTRSRLWLQLHADICGCPIALTEQAEATALGAAMCAAVGAGAFPGLAEAGTAMVKTIDRIEPDPAAYATYDAIYRHYLSTYDALRETMHALAKPSG
jgi:ribulokinase